MKTIKIAKDISLPLEIITQTIAILAKRRAGKSYTMRRLVEEISEAGQQVVLVDPKGDQWGIRSSADGKGPGIPIIILGGEHGDVPLEVNGGEVVAKLVVEERVSILIDLSIFRKHEVATFMTAFLENLYRLKAKEEYRTPVMLVIDEADAIAPQKPQKGEERMLGAAEDIVRRGGQRGIGCALITQRSAVLNKNVLTQAQMLVVLRTIAPQDLAAMKAWIDVHGDMEQGKTLMDSLPSLPVGDAWFWSPGWPTAEGIFQRSHVLPIRTFDSGATPTPGEKKIMPKNMADIDLNVLKTQMAATIEKAKADDPKMLKKRIAELERVKLPIPESKPTQKQQVSPEFQQKIVEKAVKDARKQWEIEYRKIMADVKKQFDANVVFTHALFSDMKKIVEIASRVSKAKPAQKIEIHKIPMQYSTTLNRPIKEELMITNMHIPEQTMRDHFPTSSELPENQKLGKGELRVLTAIAQHEEGVTREQITVLTGYKRSSRDTYLQRLFAAGSAGIPEETGLITATVSGIERLGPDFTPLPTGPDLRDHLMQTLPAGEKKILEILIAAYPGEMSREVISEDTGYQRSSRDTYLQRLSARQLVVSVGRGNVKASDKLF